MWEWRNGRKQWNPNTYCFPDPPEKGWRTAAALLAELPETTYKVFKVTHKEIVSFPENVIERYAQSSLTVEEMEQELGQNIMISHIHWNTRKIRRLLKMVVQDVLERRKQNVCK